VELYNSYRPMRFSEVIGQDHVVNVIRKSFELDMMPNAYLLMGSRGTGKTSVARLITKLINCLDPHGSEPCNRCVNCEAIINGATPDFVEMDAASAGGVGDVGASLSSIDYKPALLSSRVYVIDEAHQLSMKAKDSLLKVLEEPPRKVMFILATTDPASLSATIRSRCQPLEFRRPSEKVLETFLKNICDEQKFRYEDEAITKLARHANGSFRDSLSLLSPVLSIGDVTLANVVVVHGMPSDELVEKTLKILLTQNYVKFPDLLDEVKESSVALPKFLDALVDNIFRRVAKMLREDNKDADLLASVGYHILDARKLFTGYASESMAFDAIMYSSIREIRKLL